MLDVVIRVGRRRGRWCNLVWGPIWGRPFARGMEWNQWKLLVEVSGEKETRNDRPVKRLFYQCSGYSGTYIDRHYVGMP
jgi:hypothetical protein